VPAEAFAEAATMAGRIVAVGVGVTTVDHLDRSSSRGRSGPGGRSGVPRARRRSGGRQSRGGGAHRRHRVGGRRSGHGRVGGGPSPAPLQAATPTHRFWRSPRAQTARATPEPVNLRGSGGGVAFSLSCVRGSLGIRGGCLNLWWVEARNADPSNLERPALVATAREAQPWVTGR
jgi:hypothetical protein